MTIPISFKFRGDFKALKKLELALEGEEGIPSHLTRNESLMSYASINGKGFFRIPPCVHKIKNIQRVKTFILLEEKGGAISSNDGCSQIICGPKGQRIKPFLVKKSNARFLIEEQAIMIIAENNGSNNIAVRIESLKIKEEKNNVYGERLLIFDGNCKKEWFDDDFPEKGNYLETMSIPHNILFYYFPVREAVRKSRCVGCKRPHYVRVDSKPNTDDYPHFKIEMTNRSLAYSHF